MKDPYTVLEVCRDATDEDIKKAYRELAKKYHPDNYEDSNPLKGLATEKMSEINEAYNSIRKARSAGASGTNEASPHPVGGEFSRIRALINQGRYTEANRYLDMTEPEKQGAEWHFLKGIVLSKKGWMMDGREYIEKACKMDPANVEYRSAYDKLVRGGWAGARGTQTVHTSGCSGFDICTGLMCMDYLCQCCRREL